MKMALLKGIIRGQQPQEVTRLFLQRSQCSGRATTVGSSSVSGSRSVKGRGRMRWVVVSVRQVWRQAFGKYLLLTNTATAGLIMLTGDLIQQEVEYRQQLLTKRYDYGRSLRMLSVASCQGVLQHFYYLWLDRVLPARVLRTVLKKILLDQLVVAPAFIVTFLYGVALLEAESFSRATCELRDKFLDIYRVDCMVWPPAQCLNFYLVPVRFQVLYINSVSLFYSTFLSYVKHKQSSDPP